MINMKIAVAAGRLELDKKHVRTVLRQAGNEVARRARIKLRRQAGGGRLYGSHRASAAGEAPTLLSGKLARSLVVRMFKSGEGVAIRARQFYALFLEAGARGGGNVSGASYTIKSRLKAARGEGKRRQTASTKGRSTRVLEPRPFLDAALQEAQADIGPRIRDAIVKGIAFRRGKPQ